MNSPEMFKAVLEYQPRQFTATLFSRTSENPYWLSEGILFHNQKPLFSTGTSLFVWGLFPRLHVLWYGVRPGVAINLFK